MEMAHGSNGSDPRMPAASPSSPQRSDSTLRAIAQRLKALSSIWQLLGDLEEAAPAAHIPRTLRAMNDDLASIAARPPNERDAAALRKSEKLIHALEAEIGSLAFEVPVPQFRVVMTRGASADRTAVLHLLDLMLLPEIEAREGAAGRLCALDLLITLLVTGSGDAPLQDPVGLTPRLSELSERAAARQDPRAAMEAAAFHDATAHGFPNGPDETRLRPLRRRKQELGALFFEPTVLRAVVAYNAELSRALAAGAYDSREFSASTRASDCEIEDGSVFASRALPRLGSALARRLEGAAPEATAIDRIVSSLDVGLLDPVTTRALLAPGVGSDDNLVGTAILAGLLCRAAHILDGEFPAVGLSPERLATDWVRELDASMKKEVNQRILNDGYESAQELSAIRNAFLYSLITDEHREQRRPSPAPAAAGSGFSEVNREARDIAKQARATEDIAGHDPRSLSQRIPWSTVSKVGLGGLALCVAAFFGWQTFFAGDLDALSRGEIRALSPYLERGHRSGNGAGSAFVGTMADRWTTLSADVQFEEAIVVAASLRAIGVRDIMIYDNAGTVLIQALGDRAPRLVSPAAAESEPTPTNADPTPPSLPTR